MSKLESVLLFLFLDFWNLDQILNILKKKMILMVDVFPKLRTEKDLVKQMSKNSLFRRNFDKQHGKRSQTLLKSARKHLYHIYWSLCRTFSFKKSLLRICKILGVFANTLTVNDKYSFLNKYKLTQSIQMHLSNK